ncbi:hypothetical protein AWC38_SpisGene20716 [Stylophora pistillata]|uniref:Uncharacterized protein n=1 Tax=Stylophora pistillata TaxID=50429 RepID=A0A2B4RBQ1_STYPI|nr:hypothetical protein AWC38_SpisGene20716 [Stylophora pistillata]
MTSPSELVLQDHGFNAGNLGLLQDFDIGGEVTPVDVEDGAQAALMEALEEVDVAAALFLELAEDKYHDLRASIGSEATLALGDIFFGDGWHEPGYDSSTTKILRQLALLPATDEENVKFVKDSHSSRFLVECRQLLLLCDS